MRVVFVDALYWVASTNPQDQWHQKALEVETTLSNCTFVTTEAVLTEFLNFFSGYGAVARRKAARIAYGILARADVEVIQQSHSDFLAAIALYEARPDKSYSLTDCHSMNTMRERSTQSRVERDQPRRKTDAVCAKIGGEVRGHADEKDSE